MSAIIKEIYWQEYDTTTQIRTVRADIICDAIADLPSGGIMTNYKLDIGSRAKVIADGSEWEIQSSGSWVRQPSKLQLDLTGYATESWVNGELSGYVPATTYSTDQAAQDAVIADKWGYTRPTIGGTGDFNAAISSGYYRYNGAPANAPTGANGEFGVLMVYAAGSYISQIAHCFLSSQYGLYIRSSTNTGSTWTAWTQI